MREFAIGAKDDGRRLEKWLLSAAPNLSMGLAQKYFRQKDIKINGRPAKREALLRAGDVVRAYIPDECFDAPSRPDPLLSRFRWNLDILYEDEHVLIIDKRPGMMVHGDEGEKVDTLVTHMRAYLYQKGEFDPRAQDGFAPVLCNRIDRFTGGIVIAAKTEQAMRILNQKMRDRQIEKQYLCIALGVMRPQRGALEGYILKQGKRVSVSGRQVPGSQYARTDYRTLAGSGDLSLVECTLVTGRTHQIRAQFAAAGHPLLGDSQYGDGARNRQYGANFQTLYAYKVCFAFEGEAGALEYLNGREFVARNVPFVRAWFPEHV